MSATENLIFREEDGGIGFGNHLLEQKAKVSDFVNNGDIYKVKSYRDITKLERNEMFVYESVPGSTVRHLKETENGMEFQVEGAQDVQITVEMEPDTVYGIRMDGENAGTMKTNLSGKLSFSVELEAGRAVSVKIER